MGLSLFSLSYLPGRNFRILMVVGLVSHGNLLLPDLLPQLVVNERDPAGWRRGLLLKDIPHVVEKPGGAGEQGWRALRVVKEVLGVWITLLRC